MKKTTYCYAVLTASAALALGSAFTAFAAEWKEIDGSWVYVENNGNYATDTWKEDNGVNYYLGSNGFMVTDTLLNLNENFYYVRSNGAMLTNSWRQIQNPEWQGDDLVDEASWYYFGANGRAFTSKEGKAEIYNIGDKKYVFDQYGRMVTGWISETGERVEEDNWQEGIYYADEEGDGDIVVNAWVYATVTDDDNEDDSNPTYHFYFNSNGKKAISTDKTLGDHKYLFDERGVAVSGWHQDSDGDWKFYGGGEDCYLHTGWFQAVPHEQMNSDANADGTSYYYYAGSNGKITESQFKTIDGKTYAFNSNGEMITGLKVFTFSEENSKEIAGYTSVDYLDNLPSGPSDTREVYYLTSDSGVKTGTQSIGIDGTTYTFSFKSNGAPKGAGITGIDGGYIYDHGRRLTAEEGTKYQPVSWYQNVNGNEVSAEYLLAENGAIQKNKKNIKDQDGYYYCTDKNGILLHDALGDKCTEKH